jgi:predicted DNA binding CopG/RHH family protein
MKTIKSWEEVPLSFSSETEEARFWQEHQIDARLMEGALAGTDQTESTTITVRFDPRMLARLKRLARSRYLNYQSMMKQWIAERLEKELRD